MSIWNSRYDSPDYIFGTSPNDFLNANCSAIHNGGTVLCIGEGEGRNAVHLAKLGFQVTAMDASSVGLAKAKALAELNHVSIQTIVADLSNFDFGISTWDCIVSIFCHLPPDLRKSVHSRVQPALKPNGLFLLEAYNPEQLRFKTGGPSDPSMLYSRSMLQDDFADLKILSCNELEREIQEGSAHNGHSAVVQYIGQVKT